MARAVSCCRCPSGDQEHGRLVRCQSSEEEDQKGSKGFHNELAFKGTEQATRSEQPEAAQGWNGND